MIEWPPPTDDVQRLVDLLGPDAALKLFEAHGGTRLYIAHGASESQLAGIIGDAAAQQLSALYAGQTIKVPLGRAWRILVYRARGMSYRETARKASCTEGQVWATLDRYGRTAHQFDLFR